MSARRDLNNHVADIARLYTETGNQSEVARAYGVTPKAIRVLLVRHGIVARPADGRPPSGTAHYLWKGDVACYSSLHYRVYRLRGTASAHPCEHCGTTDPDRPREWANRTGDYADVFDFFALCKSCHKHYDLARRRGPGNLSLTEAARCIGMLPATFRDHVRRGLVAAQKTGDGKTCTLFVTPEALADYLARRAA